MLYNSLFEINGFKGGIPIFVGLGNFSRAFSDPKLITSISFTLIFTFFSILGHLILGMILALVLNYKFRGQQLLRTIVLIPWAMPMVVAGIAARWAFNDQFGLIRPCLKLTGHLCLWVTEEINRLTKTCAEIGRASCRERV